MMQATHRARVKSYEGILEATLKGGGNWAGSGPALDWMGLTDSMKKMCGLMIDGRDYGVHFEEGITCWPLDWLDDVEEIRLTKTALEVQAESALPEPTVATQNAKRIAALTDRVTVLEHKIDSFAFDSFCKCISKTAPTDAVARDVVGTGGVVGPKLEI